MPMRSKKICPKCLQLRDGRCQRCYGALKPSTAGSFRSFTPERKARYDRNRLPAHKRGYDSRWRFIRDSVLSAEPLCRECAKAGRIKSATEVDHILPLSAGGTHDRANLQPLCRQCHNRKTRMGDMGGGSKSLVAPDKNRSGQVRTSASKNQAIGLGEVEDASR